MEVSTAIAQVLYNKSLYALLRQRRFLFHIVAYCGLCCPWLGFPVCVHLQDYPLAIMSPGFIVHVHFYIKAS